MWRLTDSKRWIAIHKAMIHLPCLNHSILRTNFSTQMMNSLIFTKWSPERDTSRRSLQQTRNTRNRARANTTPASPSPRTPLHLCPLPLPPLVTLPTVYPPLLSGRDAGRTIELIWGPIIWSCYYLLYFFQYGYWFNWLSEKKTHNLVNCGIGSSSFNNSY